MVADHLPFEAHDQAEIPCLEGDLSPDSNGSEIGDRCLEEAQQLSPRRDGQSGTGQFCCLPRSTGQGQPTQEFFPT